MSLHDTDSLRSKLEALFGAEMAIENEIGRGGMAAVFAAFAPGLQRRVAVKMLLPQYADDQLVAERFLREGNTVASLQHPHVVSVYGVRSNEVTKAIVMQYIEGRSLDQVLAEQGTLPLAAVGSILTQVAAALQHAHDRGVIHRDVKPANVLIDLDGRAVVTDFGIARRKDGFATTQMGLVLGTTAYMSPEQRAGERVTPATDQYAFGVMAFELLTGRLPFVGGLGDVIRGHMTEAPPLVSRLRAEIPQDVEELVNRLLAKDPVARWPSLAEAERIFGSLAFWASPRSQAHAAQFRTPVSGDGMSAIPATNTATWRTRHRGLVAVTVVAVLIGLGWFLST